MSHKLENFIYTGDISNFLRMC